MGKVVREFLFLVAVVSAVVMIMLGFMGLSHMDTIQESNAIQDQVIAELQQTIAELEMYVGILKDHEILLIVGTGREVTIHTTDGRELRCYFPDEPMGTVGGK